MEYGEVLSRSWKTVWKHKVLWIFGILAGCVGGNGGGSSGGGSNTGYEVSGGDLPPAMQQYVNEFGQMIAETPWWVFVLIGLGILALAALFIYLGFTGRIALIRGSRMADEGAERLGFSELFSASAHYFWRVFGLNLLVGLVIGLALLIFVISMFFLAIGTLGVALLCLLPIACVVFILAWIVSVVLQLANVALVSDDLGIMDGLRRGWETARANVGPVLVMALILGIGGWLAGLLIALPVILVALPAGMGIVFGELAGSRGVLATGLVTAGVCLALYLPVLIVGQGILLAYIQGAWTLTYSRLRGQIPAVTSGPEVAPIPSTG
ncbi:MAG: hypothetical protein A2Z30_03640 [Chloroflexi bacterium RBG_16_64_43]|nr:MAG: hypothetical protein A2Z30_03640 [Chloroflexi bacterium RBG_16_64_43]